MTTGYYRFPTIHANTVVFACEDDLWTVPASGGIARRLTSNPGQASMSALSPDGTLLAFTGRDEGTPEVYCMPAAGGPAKRLTHLGADTQVVGWTPTGQIVFASNTAQPFFRLHHLYTISPTGGEPVRLPTGPALSISFGANGGQVICRNTNDIAQWKRYRGGRTGDIWIDPTGHGDWQRLIQLKGNVAKPVWLGERIYFVSDHEGIGNLYSCRADGSDVRRHTHHTEYYVRYPATDGQRIVYHAGADLYIYDPATNETHPIPVEFHSPQAQRKRKFVDAAEYLQDYALHPQGHSVAVICRGQPFSMALWEGAAVQHNGSNTIRHRLARWLHDGKRLVTLSDAAGEEAIEIHYADASQPSTRLDGLDIGRPTELVTSPQKDMLALSNHRKEVALVDLEARALRVVDRSRYDNIRGIAWSPDGQWIAYSISVSKQMSAIKLCRVETGETYFATQPVLRDVEPAFDPAGKYLYFLSYRDFDPVNDNLHFDLNFPLGTRPYLITLQADLPSPFIPTPRAPGKKADADEDRSKEKETDTEPIRIDLEGITERVIAFPVPEGRYGQVRGIRGKALFSSHSVEGMLGQPQSHEPPATGTLEVYDFEEQEHTVLISGITDFQVSQDAMTLIYQAGNRLRALKAGEKPGNDSDKAGRKSGWLDLDRIKVSIEPQAEWEQMYREVWRLQRDYFWVPDMSGVDWPAIYQRYLPLLKRVATRAEFSDLVWEMQGELGTSHAYEFGGDYRPAPEYTQGFLGADVHYDEAADSYKVTRIVRGDVWDEKASSPLARPGINVPPGAQLLAINGRKLSRNVSPAELLVNQAGNEAMLTFANADQAPRTVAVKTLADEMPARYREWVEANRRYVHQATGGRVGYLHIPDMGPLGYAEFHRGYLAEIDREGLIVDVRFNRGGWVSQLMLEKLARRRIGYDVQRWGEPAPYPAESVLGPMVALTNEQAGSDGDVFSHTFKLLGLGPLIGKRTWGGVIGIDIRDSLVDSTVTTQPEYSFWFKDVGWSVENYGTDPDIEIDIRPQDYAAGRDPQMERAIAEIQKLLAEHPPTLPDFGARPRLALPILPGAC